ncbi:hypothetical protein K474DRAFT_818079 [Panus rudis PR-1116 ss-1]|nr:hypothetical protein K474DRAFT_818079 [Panus rudis PR-1116 ss-1]
MLHLSSFASTSLSYSPTIPLSLSFTRSLAQFNISILHRHFFAVPPHPASPASPPSAGYPPSSPPVLFPLRPRRKHLNHIVLV